MWQRRAIFVRCPFFFLFSFFAAARCFYGIIALVDRSVGTRAAKRAAYNASEHRSVGSRHRLGMDVG